MPQVYRRHSEYAPRPASQPSRSFTIVPSPELTDVDESIVLSDLVRTGEASRLRRRGALRLDHNLATTTRPAGLNQPLPYIPYDGPPPPRRPFALPAQPTMPMTPSWVTSDAAGDDAFDTWIDLNPSTDPASASGSVALDEQRRAGDHEDEECFILYCGGKVSEVSATDYSKPFQPSPLAIPRPPVTKASSRPAAPKTNGCGAIIHLRAYSQRTSGVFVGKQQATEAVVPMDAAYFERSIVTRMMKSACGCVREGVGCAVCGNPLGTRYAPCQAASEGIFKHKCPAPPRATRPLHPAGPSYWGSSQVSQSHSSANSPRRSPNGAFYVYTFFADHVSSSPTCSPSPSEKAEQQQPISSSSLRADTWLGYTPTASPRPYSPAFAPNPSTPEPAPVEPLNIPRRVVSAYARRMSIFDPVERPGYESRESDAYDVPELEEASFDDGLANDVDDADRVSIDVRLRGGLDADGVLVENENIVDPGSPDKNEIMTWPGR